MAKKTINQVDVNGKRVLMRVDFNVPLENGAITDDRRIRMALPSIRSVIDRGGSVVLISHLGRPEGTGPQGDLSLAPCAKALSEMLGRPVKFPSSDCIDSAAHDAVGAMKAGDVVLLENLRFHEEEGKGVPNFAEKLAAYGDFRCEVGGLWHRPSSHVVLRVHTLRREDRPVGAAR